MSETNRSKLMSLTTLMGAATVALSTSVSAGTTKIDVASVFGTSNYLGQALLRVTDDIRTMTDGELDMKVHNPGDLVPPLETFNAVSSGAVEVGFDWVGYWSGTVPVVSVFGGLPFGPNETVMNSWVFDGGGKEILNKAYEPYNIHAVPCMISPPETGGWYSKEITGPEDFDGLSIRIAGFGAKVLNKLGASTQLIPGGEIYLALERGRVDAAEFATPMIDISMGFNEVVDHYHFPGWHQRANWDTLMFNKATWDGLSDSHKRTVEVACRANIQRALSDHMPLQAAAMEKFRAEGVQFHRFPDSVLAELSAAWAEVRAEEFADKPLLKEAFESLAAHEAMFNDWDHLQSLKHGE
ncbi:TRAP transporter substrate-binding protein [Marinovum sp. 2_MG-2023]|uniref:TRAP transporter substrate-binding protein n=1 Tax=unclassified Marinovum TaxID=2647166 RepID=UPI0026E44BF4|nr:MULTISPECIES: TRAP transporter substrate-binding protein [unclassified Marinovum]MDO6732398.1 TRAP transporter substrate-binding protein [Marinovum sp. 2_MG-2023]MDO6781715.1 TRAP transporter substrate-binding protein [Marinovum sp. 1_MG-2023]